MTVGIEMSRDHKAACGALDEEGPEVPFCETFLAQRVQLIGTLSDFFVALV